ncbi:MAG TPA: hypothetical protein VNO56_05750 [Gaiellaceae bacterium]|nr:hypothetical protein [Gaiellaceae bacterium]
MLTTTRDRVDEIRALEELWAAPAAPEPGLRPGRQWVSRVRAHPAGIYLLYGWIAYLATVWVFQPDPEPGMVWPAWMLAASAATYLLLVGAGALACFLLPASGYGLAVVAGGLGMALAVGCRAAEHHLGNWWLAELGATAALTGLAAVGLAQRLRRE